MSKILIIAPHPDDEVLGCGGTIKKKSQNGDTVYLCVVTETYEPEWSRDFFLKRKQEIKKVEKILGIKKTFFLRFPTAKLDTVLVKDLNKVIAGVVSRVRPDFVYIPHKGDLHTDHRLVHEGALVATRPSAESSVKKIYSYETLSETEWGMEHFCPNVYEDISKTISSKLKAMKVYASELKKPPHPRSLEIIKVLAKKRGSEVGCHFAESFTLVRSVEK